MSNRFTYQQRPAENWQQRSEQRGGSFVGFLADSVQTFQVQKAENWIRILPPTWDNPKHYGYDVFVHYGVGPQNATVLCNLKMFNTPCCVCEAYTRADTEGRDDAYDYKASRRVLVWLINRKEETQPLAWAMPWTFDRDVSKLCKDRQTGELYQIDHPEAGYDVSFDREGEVPAVKYVGIQISRRPSPVAEKFLEYIMEHPLPSILVKRTYEEVRALFEGGEAVKDPAAPPIQTTEQAKAQQPAPVQQPAAQEHRAPWDAPTTVAVPALPQTVALCANQVSFQGQSLACSYQAGHKGNCDFSRMLAQPVAPVAPSAPAVPQQAAPAAPAATGGTRAAALRERFAQRG